MCLLCFRTGETNQHLLLSFSLLLKIWNWLFGIFNEQRVCPPSLMKSMHIRFKGFGSRKEKRISWRCVIFAIIWCLLWERNNRTFRSQSLIENLFVIKWCIFPFGFQLIKYFWSVFDSHPERFEGFVVLILLYRTHCPPFSFVIFFFLKNPQNNTRNEMQFFL